jgi:hypothetical protein
METTEPVQLTCYATLEKKCSKVNRWKGDLQGNTFTLYIPHTIISDGDKVTITITGNPPQCSGGALFHLEKAARNKGDDKYILHQQSVDDWGNVYLPQRYRKYDTVSIKIEQH